MSHSISTLLTLNLQDVCGENDPERRRAAVDEIYTEDVVFYDPSKNVYRGRDEIDGIAGRSGLLIPTLAISSLPSLKKRAMAGGSNGYPAAPARDQHTPGRTLSSLIRAVKVLASSGPKGFATDRIVDRDDRAVANDPLRLRVVENR